MRSPGACGLVFWDEIAEGADATGAANTCSNGVEVRIGSNFSFGDFGGTAGPSCIGLTFDSSLFRPSRGNGISDFDILPDDRLFSEARASCSKLDELSAEIKA